MENPYVRCPVFETDHFILRLIRPDDTEELLRCYSDPQAQKIFNADNCTGDFHMHTAAEMGECVAAWIRAYEQEEYVRFAIVAKALDKAVGTVEMFGMVGVYQSPVGILRLDICSEYERKAFLDELFALCVNEFFPLFGVEQILHKTVPAADERVQVLEKYGFQPCEIPERAHYWGLGREECHL